jgi:hypothetical protein
VAGSDLLIWLRESDVVILDSRGEPPFPKSRCCGPVVGSYERQMPTDSLGLFASTRSGLVVSQGVGDSGHGERL